MLENFTLAKKIIGGFIAIALVTLAVGYVGYDGAQELAHGVELIGKSELPKVENLQIIEREVINIQMGLTQALNPNLSEEQFEQAFKDIDNARVIYKKAWDKYTTLPQTAEEKAEWEKFVILIGELREINLKSASLARKLQKLGLRNPVPLERELQRFIGDHHKARYTAVNLIENNQDFKGGDNHRVCNFGKWLTTFDSTNANIKSLLAQTQNPHEQFHAAVGQIKSLVKNGNKEAAKEVYENTMKSAAEEVFKTYDKLLAVTKNAREIYEELAYNALVVALAKQNDMMIPLRKVVEAASKHAEHAVAVASVNQVKVERFVLGGMLFGFSCCIRLWFLPKSQYWRNS